MSKPLTKGDLLEALTPLKDHITGLDAKFDSLRRDMALGFYQASSEREALSAKIDGVQSSLRREMALGFDRADAKLERAVERLDAKIDHRYSDTMSHLDAFMAQTLAVRTDQTFLIHRLDKLEGK